MQAQEPLGGKPACTCVRWPEAARGFAHAWAREGIAATRRYYNATVERFNTRQQSFPAMLVAGPLGFSPAEFFKADAADRVAPTSEFGR